MVASQDEELLNALRGATGIPIIRLARGSVLLLEQPSKSTTSKALKDEKKKWIALSEPESLLVKTVIDHERKQSDTPAQSTMRRKRKAKGPNPLSCKKKKPDDPAKAKRTRRPSKTSDKPQEV